MRPGSLNKLKREGVVAESKPSFITLPNNSGRTAEIIYLGSGGIMAIIDGEAILIDPFFSHQRTGKIAKSVLLGKRGRATLQSDRKMLDVGMNVIRGSKNGSPPNILAIISAHSHYDHLMDIPAVYTELGRRPMILLTKSGYNIIHNTVDSAKTVVLENHFSTRVNASDPIVISRSSGTVRVYPILAHHNPHFRNIKFFSGEQPKPVHDLVSPFGRTRANLWLEGNTFSFLIDFVDSSNDIQFRMFIQSSSCDPPWGIPPDVLLEKSVDIGFVGVASYAFSPDYPCALLSALRARQIMWVHWEDFFRKYTRSPKTVRGSDIPAFFRLPCVAPYKTSGKLLKPRVRLTLTY
jgi:hypothetical protein